MRLAVKVSGVVSESVFITIAHQVVERIGAFPILQAVPREGSAPHQFCGFVIDPFGRREQIRTADLYRVNAQHTMTWKCEGDTCSYQARPSLL